MKRISKMNEAAWAIGIILCALGVALCTKAAFGLSMVAAPAYIVHLRMVQMFAWYTQGTSEYIWQGFLMIILCLIVRKFRPKYLLSFATAVISGLAIDMWISILGGGQPYDSMALRIFALVLGELITALAIAFFFRTDMPLQIYELLVTEISRTYGFEVPRVKMASDIIMFVLSVIMALLLNHGFKGVGVGTVLITLVNAPLIAMFGKLIDKVFTFEARFPKLLNALT